MTPSDMNFINAIEDIVDMDNIKDRDDLERRLEKAFKSKKTHEPTSAQVDFFETHYGIEPIEPEELPPLPPPTVPTHRVREVEYRIELRTLTTIKKPTPTLYRTVDIIPVGFKAHQIRDVKTGRILRWE